MKRAYPFLALLTLLGFSVNHLAAAPENDESPSQNIFQQLDKNSDGTVTADEVPEEKERFFDHLIRMGDQNKDGKLTKAEFKAGLKKEDQKFPAGDAPNGNRGPRNFDFKMFLSRLDRNGDKKISKEELPEPLRERMEPLFKRLNKDDISLDEFAKFGPMLRGRPEGKPPENRTQKRGDISEGAERFFTMLDTNKDGKLTLDEAPERGKQFLRRLLDNSGKGKDAELTKEEFRKELAAFRPDRRRPGREDDKEMKRPEMQKNTERRPDRSSDRSSKRSELPEEAQQFFERLDTNKDGKLTLEEAPIRGKLFVRQLLDKSGKGADDELTKEEFQREFTSFRPDQRRPGRENEKEMKRPEMRNDTENRSSTFRGRPPMPAFMQTLDSNKDGKLDKTELNQLQSLLEKLDQNEDGLLDMAELMGVTRRPIGSRGRDRMERSRRPEQKRPERKRPQPESKDKDSKS